MLLPTARAMRLLSGNQAAVVTLMRRSRLVPLATSHHIASVPKLLCRASLLPSGDQRTLLTLVAMPLKVACSVAVSGSGLICQRRPVSSVLPEASRLGSVGDQARSVICSRWPSSRAGASQLPASQR